MAQGVDNLTSAAFQSSGDLRVLAPKGGAVKFEGIAAAGAGAALAAARSISLEGEGSILFENLWSLQGTAACSLSSDVTSSVFHLQVRNSTAHDAGGAFLCIWSSPC